MSLHQFYIMHCTKADSVLNAAGFSVRAASTTDPGLLRSAFELPAYELPMEMWAKRPIRAEAPRRLARLAEGWIVHSSYLETDTTNRDRAYFTHALHDPSADLQSVLRSWGTPSWATDYPSGAPQSLPEPKPLSAGPFISDAAVTMFLGNAPTPQVAFDVQTQPARLSGDRKLLLEHFLNGIVKTLEQPATGRRRFYVHAEPGLVALLLYAAARLLPENLVRDLTFSTFEPAHRGFREFKLATVVGTYLGHPAKGLEPEYATTRGYALDTFHPQHSSPEVFVPVPGVSALVTLATAGQWAAIDRAKAIAGSNADALPRIAGALTISPSLERFEAGQPTAEDLISLAREPSGFARLQEREAEVWPHVQRLAPRHPDLFATFAPWFQKPERVQSVRDAAIAALKSHDLGSCIAQWNILARTQPPQVLGDLLLEILRQPKGTVEALPAEFRAWLRREVQDRITGLPKEILGLLRPVDVPECDAILSGASLPAAWRSTAILVLLRKSESREVPADLRQRAAIHLTQAAPDVLAAYVGSAFDNRAKHPELWNELTAVMAPITIFDRLLAAGEAMPAKRWRQLFEELHPFAPNADPQWRMNSRRGHWLRVAENPVLWQQLAAPLDGRFLAGDYSKDADWGELQLALQTSGNFAPVPDDVRMKIWSYSIVRTILHDSLARSQFSEEDVVRAFWSFGVPPPAPLEVPMALPVPEAPATFDVAAEEAPAENVTEESEDSFRERRSKARAKKADRSMVPIFIGIGVLMVTILALFIVAWPKIQKALK